MKIKKRLDARLQEMFPQFSRTQLQSWIMQSKVFINDKVENKPGTQVVDTDSIVLKAEQPKYVCRAGWKLEKALDHFNVNPEGLIIMDAGLSTGGFTDCLLQRGAKKIYGVDVGYGQVHEKIRADEKVMVMERTNLRNLKTLPLPIDLVTLDLSFISILKVLDAVKNLLKPTGELITLIKPQFEAEKHQVGKGGIIRDPAVHKEVIEKVTHAIKEAGFEMVGITESPITGTDGNKEFLAYFKRTQE